MTEFDLDQTDRLLMTTKQIRKRLDFERPVSHEVLLECIEIASRAPMGSNQERNKWLIVDDEELKNEIAVHYRENALPYLGQSDAFKRDDRGARVVDSAQYLAEHMEDAPALVIPLRLDTVEDSPLSAQAGWWGSVLPGVWSFQLALRSRGIGSCWTTLHLDSAGAVGELLGIPDTVTQCCLLPVAYYTGETFTPAPRRPAEEITFLNGWKQPIV